MQDTLHPIIQTAVQNLENDFWEKINGPYLKNVQKHMNDIWTNNQKSFGCSNEENSEMVLKLE